MGDFNFENWRQDDPRWGREPYAGETIAAAGCALGAAGDISGERPPIVGRFMTANGYASHGSGTYWAGIPHYLKSQGYASVQLNANSLLGVTVCQAFEDWKAAIRSGLSGCLLMGGPSMWTGGGHYICIPKWTDVNGYDEFLVHDPAHRQDGWHKWEDFVGWIKVLYIGGKRWKPETPEIFVRVNSGTCLENGVVLRKDPTSAGIQVGTADAGNRFDVDGKKENGYLHIKIATAGVCWISEMYAQIDGEEPADMCYIFKWRAVGPYSTGAHVKIWQKVLSSMHLYDGKIDGVASSSLESGTRRFQGMRNIEEDGWAGPNSFAAATNLVRDGDMFKVRRVRRGSDGDTVLFLQRLLSADHHYNGTLDGHCGPGTTAGIFVAQKALQLDAVDGDFGSKSWEAYLGL